MIIFYTFPFLIFKLVQFNNQINMYKLLIYYKILLFACHLIHGLSSSWINGLGLNCILIKFFFNFSFVINDHWFNLSLNFNNCFRDHYFFENQLSFMVYFLLFGNLFLRSIFCFSAISSSWVLTKAHLKINLYILWTHLGWLFAFSPKACPILLVVIAW